MPLAWLLQRSPTSVVVPATPSAAHLRENVAAGTLVLPPGAIRELDSIGASPVATQGDFQYEVENVGGTRVFVREGLTSWGSSPRGPQLWKKASGLNGFPVRGISFRTPGRSGGTGGLVQNATP